jgi:phospholipid/cholesterol/gamma-HCH transport system permease protein
MSQMGLDLGLEARGRLPEAQLVEHGGLSRLSASGSWTIREIAFLDRKLSGLAVPGGGGTTELDLSGVDQLDTAGAWLIGRLKANWERLGLRIAITGARGEHQLLIDEVRTLVSGEQPMPRPASPLVRLVADVSQTLAGMASDALVLTGVLGWVAMAAVRTAFNPLRFRMTSFVHHIEHTGLRAVPIVSLICLLIGAVILEQGAVQLRLYGGEPFAVNMLSVLALREVGVLLTAILVAGRSASAFTAEIGAMKMREEIDAMRAIGIDPMDTLVLPRILALLIVVPILTFAGDVMCLTGGGIIASSMMGLDSATYLERLQDVNVLKHFLVGIVKTPFIALIIGLIGCTEGLRVRGSAESLGRQVTSAVVKAIFLVICIDGFAAIFIAWLGY